MRHREACPACGSSKYKRNGHIHTGKQQHQCKTCGRQFVQGFEQYLIAGGHPGADWTLAARTDFVAGHLSGRVEGGGLQWLSGRFSSSVF